MAKPLGVEKWSPSQALSIKTLPIAAELWQRTPFPTIDQPTTVHNAALPLTRFLRLCCRRRVCIVCRGREGYVQTPLNKTGPKRPHQPLPKDLPTDSQPPDTGRAFLVAGLELRVDTLAQSTIFAKHDVHESSFRGGRGSRAPVNLANWIAYCPLAVILFHLSGSESSDRTSRATYAAPNQDLLPIFALSRILKKFQPHKERLDL